MIAANLLHLSFNMWEEHDSPGDNWRKAWTTLRFDEALWDELLARMAGAGFNMVVLDLGDAVRYDSHPEIAVKGAWSPERLRAETARLRQMGLELVPKLNFSTCHDAWMGPYSRCVSTPAYYEVCRNLIAEVIDLTRPRFFHLGMDEETAEHQRRYNYVVIRQNELYWHDMGFYLGEVQRHGVRPWIWSDYIWRHEPEFLSRMPASVLQSNWYYGESFGEEETMVKAYRTLDAKGYEQVPTCSNFSKPRNARLTVEFCRRHIAPERLLGFLQTPWRPTVPEYRDQHLQAIDLLSEALH